MKNTVLILFIFFTIPCALSQPRPVTLKNNIIIDTDCGIDDMRAICLMLARPEITIKAIVTSDGSLPPAEGAVKAGSLLHEFGKDNVPVSAGEQIKSINPVWRDFNRDISWGTVQGSKKIDTGAADLLLKVLKSGDEKFTIVCLGPLTNIAWAIKKDAEVLNRIDRIVWYNESVKPLQGFNYECDKESANSLFKSRLRFDVISNLNDNEGFFDTSMYEVCGQSNTDLARVFKRVFAQQPVLERLKENRFRLADDLVALYITNPELFGINADISRLNIRYNTDYNVQGIREAMADMIKGYYVAEKNVVFNRFPAGREMFNYDVRPIIDSAIARYGYEEWKANVMTDEFHGHLGVFSIVGAKMGIRARELFGAGPDMLEVITFAGSKPPYSCLTDGIQVSTGATLGMGTIRLAPDSVASPSAIFTFKSRSIRITLKKEYLDQVDKDINEGILKFGLMDDGYWKLIRHNALKYWLEWDRNKIFDIEEIINQR